MRIAWLGNHFLKQASQQFSGNFPLPASGEMEMGEGLYKATLTLFRGSALTEARTSQQALPSSPSSPSTTMLETQLPIEDPSKKRLHLNYSTNYEPES